MNKQVEIAPNFTFLPRYTPVGTEFAGLVKSMKKFFLLGNIHHSTPQEMVSMLQASYGALVGI